MASDGRMIRREEREYNEILKVGRTIDDLVRSICVEHILLKSRGKNDSQSRVV